MGLTFMLKDGQPPDTPVREKYDVIIKLKLLKFMKYCRSFCGMVKFLSSFLTYHRKIMYANVLDTE